MKIRFVSILLALFMAAGGLSARAGTRGNVEFYSPWEGAHITEGKVIITGTLSESRGKAELFFNGSPVKGVKKTGNAFSAAVTPKAGRNVVEVKGGSLSGKLNFSYGPGKSGQPVYKFHQPVLDGDCGECHRGGRPQKTILRADTCYECHDSWDKSPYIHGPIAAGECLFCHDPHGSVHPYFTRLGGKEQCTACHDQPSSQAHMSRSQHKDCGRCHDSHSGKDQNFLK